MLAVIVENAPGIDFGDTIEWGPSAVAPPVLQGLSSSPLGVLDVGHLPHGIGPSGEDFQNSDANGFFDVFTELESSSHHNSVFDVF